MSIKDEIRSHGSWLVVIRPSRFIERRLGNYADLVPLVTDKAVSFRGWSFPHINRQTPPERGSDWVGQEISASHFREIWRMYQSGQFVHLSGMLEDWHALLHPDDRNWPKQKVLGVGHSLFRITEIFEFAARLALVVADGEEVVVRLESKDSQDARCGVSRLGSTRCYPIPFPKSTATPSSGERQPNNSPQNPGEIALGGAVELFQRFGWDGSAEVLRDRHKPYEMRGDSFSSSVWQNPVQIRRQL